VAERERLGEDVRRRHASSSTSGGARKSASAPRQAIFNGFAGDAYEEAELRTT